MCATGQLPGNSFVFCELVKIRTSDMDEALLQLTQNKKVLLVARHPPHFKGL